MESYCVFSYLSFIDESELVTLLIWNVIPKKTPGSPSSLLSRPPDAIASLNILPTARHYTSGFCKGLGIWWYTRYCERRCINNCWAAIEKPGLMQSKKLLFLSKEMLERVLVCLQVCVSRASCWCWLVAACAWCGGGCVEDPSRPTLTTLTSSSTECTCKLSCSFFLLYRHLYNNGFVTKSYVVYRFLLVVWHSSPNGVFRS